jgi:hypothetical protein
MDRRTFLGSAAALAVVPAAAFAALESDQPISRATGSAGSPVSPMDFGAVGDGKTNDRQAVQAACDHAFDNGLPLDGGDRLFAVSGTTSISGKTRPYVARLRLRQLNPGQSTKTLSFDRCEQVRIDELFVDTGASPGAGTMHTAFGLQIEGGSGHRVRNVEATGQGKVSFVRFRLCSDSVFEDIYVHDGLFHDSSVNPAHRDHPAFAVVDDVVQGIHFIQCRDCTLVRPRVRDLLGNGTYLTIGNLVKPYPNMRSRGIAVSASFNCTISDPDISNVDQGIDVTGSEGHVNLQIVGGHVRDCASAGISLKSNVQAGKVRGSFAENCGMYCFYVGGSNYMGHTMDCDFIGCTAINPGYNDIENDLDGPPVVPLAHSGFLVYRGKPYPEGIRFLGCKAIDRQGFYLVGDDRPFAPARSTSAKMKEAWTGYTGSYSATFANGETRMVTLTNGSAAVAWQGGLSANVDEPFVKMPPKMQYGFLNEIPAEGSNERGPTLIDCESVGHIKAMSHGFGEQISDAYGSAFSEPIAAASGPSAR